MHLRCKGSLGWTGGNNPKPFFIAFTMFLLSNNGKHANVIDKQWSMNQDHSTKPAKLPASTTGSIEAGSKLSFGVDKNVVDSLAAFRAANPTKTVAVNNEAWEYVVMGQGEDTIVFIHGMTSAYDIWWQQIEVLEQHYQVIAMTYPAADRGEDE